MYAPFTTKQVLALKRDFELPHSHTTDSQGTQANDAVIHPLETSSVSHGRSPTTSKDILYQASSYDSDSGESHHSAEDYSAAVTLVSCFQRET